MYYPRGEEVVEGSFNVQKHPDGDTSFTEDCALKVVHSITEGRVSRSAFSEGMLVLVKGRCLKDRLLQVPEDKTFERLESKGHQGDWPPRARVGVVILPKFRNKDGFGFSPERGNILQLEAGYEQISEPGESL